jgi:putative glutamine amidotransferase
MANTSRPLIGINCDFFNASKTYSAHARVNAGYFDAILNAGGLPILMPPMTKEADLNELLDKLDGVLLTGGLDMDVRRTGAPAHPALQPMAERRDVADRLLVAKIVERKMATLAIGVGMQQLNVILGGSLFMHIPTDLPRAMQHFDPTGSGPHRHIVTIEEDTRIEEIYGTTELRVNSRHHQAIDRVATRLRVGARCPDGVVESLESIDPNWFCLGVQWHPEADTASALDLQLFDCFVQASVRSSDRLQLMAA